MVVALVIAFCIILALITITARQNSIIESYKIEERYLQQNSTTFEEAYNKLSKDSEEALYSALVCNQKLFNLWSNMSTQLLDYVRISNRFIDRNTNTGLYNKSFHMTKSLTADISFKDELESEIGDAENYLNLMKDIYHTRGVDFLNIKNRLQAEAYRSFYAFPLRFEHSMMTDPIPSKGDLLYDLGRETTPIRKTLKELIGTYSDIKERNDKNLENTLR